MRTSAIRNSRTLTQNAAMTSGSASQKISGLRKDSWNAGQPGELTMTQPRTEKTTIVLAAATAIDRYKTQRRRPAWTWACGQAEGGRAGIEGAAHCGLEPVTT
jgi:hypothetical protein